jgi:sulfoxide reductase catalytic subunit YedY
MTQPRSSEITPESLYLRRREFIANAAKAAGTAVAFGGGLMYLVGKGPPPDTPETKPLVEAAGSVATPEAAAGPDGEAITTYQAATTYNNFYELGLDKGDPAKTSRRYSPGSSSRSASTACAASRRGRWSSPGSASRSAT